MNREMSASEMAGEHLKTLKQSYHEAKYMVELMRRNNNQAGIQTMERKSETLRAEILQLDPNFENAEDTLKDLTNAA